ncbi:DEAD-box ATP-dependent RNA helicase 37-like [Bidens hawaiensis]|uniref:DEAD-box ATP-dependent RNA helicase 37-like n=1 Tax=Bidens hawaiensis TaxID=980011 RepID=UPI00404B0518
MSYFSDTYATVASKPARTNYLPPHQRDTYIPRHTSGGRGRGRNTGGRFTGRGGGGQFNAHVHPHAQNQYDRNPSQYYNVKQQLNELKLTEEEDNSSTVINFEAYEDIPVEITGSDVPQPVNTFADVDLGSVLNDNIKNRCKYVKPTPIQRHAIPVVLAGRDLMACAQTGSGKTAAFCFPIISGVLKTKAKVNVYGRRETVAFPKALVLSPTRELCCQIFEEAKKFCFQTGVNVAVAYGGAPIYHQLKMLERGVDVLVATPGRLTDMIERSKISLRKIKYLALDEADRMLDMGFEPQIRKIVERLDMPPSGPRQTLLFSATFPTEIQKMASDFLQNYIFLSVGRVGSSTDLIQQKIVFVEDHEKRNYLSNLLHDQKAKGNLGKNALTLIFVETKRSADALENWLCSTGFPATAIHGDKVQYERERALRSFKNGVTPILVATDVASRGLDISRVAHVINFDLPRDIDSYVHRIGRTGRAGKSGLATGFFNAKNAGVAKPISEIMKEAKQEAPNWLDEYAESSSSDYRYGSSKFGGRDFRSGNNGSYGNADYGGSSSYNQSYDDYYAQAMPVAGDFSASYGGVGGYESVVAGGWE